MWIVAWTINHGQDNFEDFWTVHEDEAEARAEALKLMDMDRVHCWAVAPIKLGSEPHYTEQH